MTLAPRLTVYVLDRWPETKRLLLLALPTFGYDVVTLFDGGYAITPNALRAQLITADRSAVVVWDVSPIRDLLIEELRLVLTSGVFDSCGFVVTTDDPGTLRKGFDAGRPSLGPLVDRVVVVEKPYPLTVLLHAIDQADARCVSAR